MRTFLGGAPEGEGDSVGVGEIEGDSIGVGATEGDSSGVGERVGVGDSCAIPAQIELRAIRSAILTLFIILLVAALCERRINSAGSQTAATANVVAPVHVREKVIALFTVAQKFFIDIVSDELIVQ